MNYYLDENLITKTEKTIKVQLILGGFMVLGSLGVILNSVFNLGITEEKVALTALPIYAVMLLAFTYVLFRGIQNSMLVSAARTYSKIFLEDPGRTLQRTAQGKLCSKKRTRNIVQKTFSDKMLPQFRRQQIQRGASECKRYGKQRF